MPFPSRLFLGATVLCCLQQPAPPIFSLHTPQHCGDEREGRKKGEREKDDWLLVFWAEEKKGEARLIVDPGNPGERWLRQSAQANGEVEGKEVKVPD